MVMLHGCTVGDGSLIGIGAIVLNGARIGRNCLVGAGALITEGKADPRQFLVMGAPGRVVRGLTDDEVAGLERPPRTMSELEALRGGDDAPRALRRPNAPHRPRAGAECGRRRRRG